MPGASKGAPPAPARTCRSPSCRRPPGNASEGAPGAPASARRGRRRAWPRRARTAAGRRRDWGGRCSCRAPDSQRLEKRCEGFVEGTVRIGEERHFVQVLQHLVALVGLQVLFGRREVDAEELELVESRLQ